MILRELEKEIKHYEKYLSDNTYLRKSPKIIDKHAEQCRQKVQKAIISALTSIAKVDPKTAKYLSKINYGRNCRFNYDRTLTRNLFLEVN